MKKYLLDLTEAQLPDYWPDYIPKKILAITGQHSKEFDIAPEEMEKSWAKNWHAEIKERRAKQDLPPRKPGLPMGFNMSSMPLGAKLTELEQEA